MHLNEFRRTKVLCVIFSPWFSRILLLFHCKIPFYNFIIQASTNWYILLDILYILCKIAALGIKFDFEIIYYFNFSIKLTFFSVNYFFFFQVSLHSLMKTKKGYKKAWVDRNKQEL